MKPDNIFERMKRGEVVPFSDPDYVQIATACAETKKLLLEMNNAVDADSIRDCLKKITASEVADTVNIFTPFYVNYGKNTRFGTNIFINFDCTFLDLGGIEIEDNVMLAPGVKLLSEGHPIEPEKRASLSTGKILIKKNAWIGANATILAGVTIGENSVVAAGAVVHKNVPDNVVVGGIPAKILKEL